MRRLVRALGIIVKNGNVTLEGVVANKGDPTWPHYRQGCIGRVQRDDHLRGREIALLHLGPSGLTGAPVPECTRKRAGAWSSWRRPARGKAVG